MTNAVGGMQVGSVVPAGAARPVVEALRYGLPASGLEVAHYVVWSVLAQSWLAPGGSPWLTVVNLLNIVMMVGLLVLAFVAGRHASRAGLVGIGLAVAAWYGWWAIQPLLSQPLV
jgi:hypothetical protein